MNAAALMVALLLCADDQVGQAPERGPPAHILALHVGAVLWPALDGTSWLDLEHPTDPPRRFGALGASVGFSYRHDVLGLGPARLQLGATFALAFHAASGTTSVPVNGGAGSLDRDVTSRLLYLTGDARLQRAAGPWRPFVEAGIGYYLEDVSTQLSDGMVETTYFRSNTVGGWIGAGIDVVLWEWASWDLRLAFAGRVHLVGFGTPGSALVSGGSLGGPIWELAPAIAVGLR